MSNNTQTPKGAQLIGASLALLVFFAIVITLGGLIIWLVLPWIFPVIDITYWQSVVLFVVIRMVTYPFNFSGSTNG